MRRVHGAARRQAHRLVPDARRGRGRPRDHDGGRARLAREDERGAVGVRGMRRAAVRVLHARVRGGLDRAPPVESFAIAGGDQARPVRQPVPLRHVFAGVRGRAEGVAGRGTRGAEELNMSQQPVLPVPPSPLPSPLPAPTPAPAASPTPAPGASPAPPPLPTVKHVMSAGHASNPQRLEVNVIEGDLKPWDLETRFDVVTGRQVRLDGAAKVTGRAKYTFDVTLPGMLWGRMVRASIPAGDIVKIDTSRAEAFPGVKAVWTTEHRKVRFAGQDVAAVAAISPEVAEEAARLVSVTYEQRAHVTDLEKAMDESAPLVYSLAELPADASVATKALERRGNILGPRVPRNGTRGDVAKGFAEAEVTVESTYRVPVHTHAPLETHGVVASWEGDQLTIHASTQGTFTVREGMAEYLGIDRKNITVKTEHMGGGFGSKLHVSATGSAF